MSWRAADPKWQAHPAPRGGRIETSLRAALIPGSDPQVNHRVHECPHGCQRALQEPTKLLNHSVPQYEPGKPNKQPYPLEGFYEGSRKSG